MDDIHTRIKTLRASKKMSMQALADACGVTWQTVQQWEQPDGTAPKRARLEAVAKALGTTPAHLISGTHQRTGDGCKVEQITAKYGRDDPTISEILAILNATDDVGLKMALAAVRVALSGHKAAKANRRA